MLTKEQITAALRKLGPSSPDALATELGCARPALQYHLKAMLGDKTITNSGTRLSRIVALTEQKLAAAPTPPSTGAWRRRRKTTAPARREAPAPSSPRTTSPLEVIHPGDRRRLPPGVVNGAQALVYTALQTETIAQLLLQHFKA